jgi:hypothetical protein
MAETSNTLGTGARYIIIDRGHKHCGKHVIIVGSFNTIWSETNPWKNPSYMLVSEFLCAKGKGPYTLLESNGRYYYGILEQGFGTVVAPEWVL